jgi:ribonucleoside-diphosphate reductase alpha chain
MFGGEVPLYNYESCCLGSLNLYNFYDLETRSIDWQSLEEVTRLAIRFLDNVQEVSHISIEKINQQGRNLRRLGVGVMGWADLLAEMGVPYDSEEATDLAEYISWFISFFGWQESIELAKERGAFPHYNPDKVDLHVVEKVLNNEKFNPYKFDMEAIRKAGVRNISITSIAPTGSLALLAGVNGAIEPFFALAYKRHITEGVGNFAKSTIIEVNPLLFRKLNEYGLSDELIDEVKEYVVKHGSIQDFDKIPEKLRLSFKTSHDLKWEDHLEMQISWQDSISNAVSKTVNLSEDATVDDVYNCYLAAWNSGAKGLTVYVNNSRSFQVLNVGT